MNEPHEPGPQERLIQVVFAAMLTRCVTRTTSQTFAKSGAKVHLRPDTTSVCSGRRACTKRQLVIDTNPGTFRTLGGLLVAVMLVSVAPAWAADPIIGTWKLDVAESTFSTAMQGVPPKELVEVIREVEGGRIELAQSGTQQDGERITFRITYPAQGGLVTIDEGQGTEGLTFVETLVSPGNWYATTLQAGKQVILRHKVVGADGKTKRETVRGTDERGRPFEQIEVYERIAADQEG